MNSNIDSMKVTKELPTKYPIFRHNEDLDVAKSDFIGLNTLHISYQCTDFKPRC